MFACVCLPRVISISTIIIFDLSYLLNSYRRKRESYVPSQATKIDSSRGRDSRI